MQNMLQAVQTFQPGGLALLENSGCFIANSNSRFLDFETYNSNRGTTVTFSLPSLVTVEDSLIAVFQPVVDQVHSLTADLEASASYAFDASQLVYYDLDRYMKDIARPAVASLGRKVELHMATRSLTNTFRFFGNTATPITTYGQLANAAALFRDYGAAPHDTCGFIPMVAVPDIVNSGLQQFATYRNNEDAHSWELGPFAQVDWCESNGLSKHIAGQVGQQGSTLTFVSINAAGDQITFSGAPSNVADALQENDKLQFLSNDLRYLQEIGKATSNNPVQVRVTAQVASDVPGTVIVPIFPALVATPGAQDQNINRPLAITDTASGPGNHTSGLIFSGKALYLAMPKLPQQDPFPTHSEHDPETGVSLRLTYGTRFGENQYGFIHDMIYGSTLVDKYAMELIFPS